MFHLKLHCYNGMTFPIAENLSSEEARSEAAAYIHRARSKRGLSLTVSVLEPGVEWELQWPDQGTSDYEGILTIHHQTFKCRECGSEHETRDDAATCCEEEDEGEQCSDCTERVFPDDPYYATPCGTFCDSCMEEKHARECGVCAAEFDLEPEDEEVEEAAGYPDPVTETNNPTN